VVEGGRVEARGGTFSTTAAAIPTAISTTNMRSKVMTKQHMRGWLRFRTPIMTVTLVRSHMTPIKMKKP
jgi:hypothetical protein